MKIWGLGMRTKGNPPKNLSLISEPSLRACSTKMLRDVEKFLPAVASSKSRFYVTARCHQAVQERISQGRSDTRHKSRPMLLFLIVILAWEHRENHGWAFLPHKTQQGEQEPSPQKNSFLNVFNILYWTIESLVFIKSRRMNWNMGNIREKKLSL